MSAAAAASTEGVKAEFRRPLKLPLNFDIYGVVGTERGPAGAHTRARGPVAHQNTDRSWPNM